MRKRRALAGLAAILLSSWASGRLAAQVLTGRIVYSCGSNICLVDLVSGVNRQLGVSGFNAKFSPDGTRILFQASRPSGIYVMNADGTNPTRIVSFGGVPGWSADGQKIAFHSNGIWIANADGSGLQQITNHGRWAAWSPDMTQIAFSSDLDTPDSDLWIVNPDGTNAHRVLSRRGADIDVVWTASSRILFGGFVDAQASYEIFAFDPATFALTRLTSSGKQDFEPSGSPDGTMVAFASLRKPDGVYVMNADGSSPHLIIAKGRQPSWGP